MPTKRGEHASVVATGPARGSVVLVQSVDLPAATKKKKLRDKCHRKYKKTLPCLGSREFETAFPVKSEQQARLRLELRDSTMFEGGYPH